ncbi:MAG: hypothetical protein WCM76_04005 [Bacteroidota bacterium]
MIRYIEHSALDKRKWDCCIENAAMSPAYALSWYLDIACEQWDALVEDDYSAVMPLPWRKKGGIKYIYPPYFIQQLGIFSTATVGSAKTAAFLNAIPESFKYAEINLNSTNAVSELTLSYTRRTNTELQLNTPFEKIKSGYSDNLKRNLRKAVTSGNDLTDAVIPEALVTLFKHNKGAELNKFSEQDYAVLTHLMKESIKRGAGFITGVCDDKNTLIAGAFFIQTGQRIIFLFSGAGAEAKENAAIPQLLNNQIAAYADRQMLLDFEGSDNKNLARFYKSFGSEETYYHRVIIDRLPKIAKYVIKWRRMLKKN